MGFFRFAWLKTIVKVAVQLLGGGGAGVATESGLPFTIGQLLPAVERGIRYQGLDTKAKFDEWLTLADQATGEDKGAFDLFRDLPADKEELLFDHAIEVARVYGYHLLHIDGYWVERGG